jgi:hypothetical protein
VLVVLRGFARVEDFRACNLRAEGVEKWRIFGALGGRWWGVLRLP